MSVELSYFRRVYGNFNVVDDRARSASDFDLFSITAPRDPRLPASRPPRANVVFLPGASGWRPVQRPLG